MKKSLFSTSVTPFTFALAVAVILLMGSAAFASERQPAMARSPERAPEPREEFRALKSELEKEYQALFKVLDTSVRNLTEVGQPPVADRQLSMTRK